MFDLLFGWTKASKCKKLVKRVQCRLKVLKNKRGCIVNQLREDVAHLLKHGQHQSAVERVEQLVMDQSMVQVYDLLDQFCEFIVINIPYIRKHRDCPDDISEAASTLIFSSARLGELPELLLIRKLFAERYGRTFVTTALELLPGNLVNNQIKDNLYMKKVPDDVKYRSLDEIARTCIQAEPLLLEYKPELQEDEIVMDLLSENKKTWKEPFFEFDNIGQKWINGTDSSSEASSKLPEEVIYLDDIEEFVSPMIKDGNLQDQRLFVFRSFHAKSNYGVEQKRKLPEEMSLSRSSRKTRKASRKSSRRRRRSVSQESTNITDIECAIYYGASRCQKEHRNTVLSQQNRKRDHKLTNKCSLEHPYYTKDGNIDKLRAMTMPSTRPKESSLTDNIVRSNSYPFGQSCSGYSSCNHIHPKLPDYDELAAKFMELKRANLQKQQKLTNLQD